MPVHEATWKESLVKLGRALQIPDLRQRILFMAGMFALFVAGLHVPAPYVDTTKMKELADLGVFGLFDILSGGAFRRLSILALGIVPYINASIIMQLLGIAVPSIQRMQKEGEDGRKRISSITRWGTVILAFIQAAGIGLYLNGLGAVPLSQQLAEQMGIAGTIIGLLPLVLVMTAGTSFLMWVGEQLTDKGIGNGISLLIFAGIMIRLPDTFWQIYKQASAQSNPAFTLMLLALIIAIFIAIIVFITYVHQATRQIPIQHAKRQVGGRTFGTANTYLPLKIATAGVIPIIFAISVVMLPSQIALMYAKAHNITPNTAMPQSWIDFLMLLSPGAHWLGGVIYFLLVIFFTYFYTAVIYNVQDISDNLKNHGSFVPGLRPGKQTEQYIDQVLTRITFAGAIFLGIVALLPYIIPAIFRSADPNSGANMFPLWGGTSLLIVIGVALETMKQVEAHLVMRHYEGFIK